MYASALPCAVAFYALWHPPAALRGTALFAYVLAVLVVVRFFTAMYEIPSAALAPELSTDYNLRTRLFAVRSYFGTIAGGMMSILLNVVFLRHDSTHTLGVLNRAGYAEWGAIAAGVILISILWSSWSTHRLIPTLSVPPRRVAGLVTLLAQVAGTLRNPSFLALMASGLVSSAAGGIGAALQPYMTLYFWGLSPQVAGPDAVRLRPGGPASVRLRRAAPRAGFGKKQSLIGLSAISLVTSLVPISLRLVGAMPPNGSPWLIPILIVDQFLVVALNVMTGVIVASMFADLADDNAVRTGARVEGFLFALNGLIPKISTGLGAFGGSAHARLGRVPRAIPTGDGLRERPARARPRLPAGDGGALRGLDLDHRLLPDRPDHPRSQHRAAGEWLRLVMT